MQLNKRQIMAIIKGSTVLGTGGGGRYDSALESTKSLRAVELISIDQLGPQDVVVTAYGAGGLTKPKNTRAVIGQGLELLQDQLDRPIKAIVPVEIGPYSLAAAFEIAANLGVPVVDGDLVGFRSVPEIYVELVTLAGLSRLPLVFGNNENDLVLLKNVRDAESLERIIRTFADGSRSNTFVIGYPFSRQQLRQCLASGSVSYCLEINDKLGSDFRTIGSGKVIKDVKKEVGGFTMGYLLVKGSSGLFRVEFKNEYLVLLKNNEVLITCPDFICVVDKSTKLGLNNGDSNLGKDVTIFAKPAIEQWLSKNGLALFSPKKLGLNYQQMLLEQLP